jgi:two-component system, NarL family, nitrate/nitrite response regulator NarL
LRSTAYFGDAGAVVLRCLLVDDNQGFLSSATRLLESQGLAIVGSASSADEALRMVDEHRPDVVLVDVQLGEEDGIALARKLAQSTSVVLISTHSRDELAELIADSPAQGFLPKKAISAQAIARLLD